MNDWTVVGRDVLLFASCLPPFSPSRHSSVNVLSRPSSCHHCRTWSDRTTHAAADAYLYRIHHRRGLRWEVGVVGPYRRSGYAARCCRRTVAWTWRLYAACARGRHSFPAVAVLDDDDFVVRIDVDVPCNAHLTCVRSMRYRLPMHCQVL